MKIKLSSVLRKKWKCPNCGCGNPLDWIISRIDEDAKSADCFHCLGEIKLSAITAEFRKVK